MKVKNLSYLSYGQSNFKEFELNKSTGFNLKKNYIRLLIKKKSKNTTCVQFNLLFNQ